MSRPLDLKMTKFILMMLLLIPIELYAVDNEIIYNDLFSIEVPADWEIENNKFRQIIIANSKDTYDGWPTEMLMTDYCVIGGQPKEAKAVQCGTCSEKIFIDILRQEKNHDGDYPIEKTINQGVTEFKVELISNDGAKISKLLCHKNGHVFMMFMSSRKPTEGFNNIFQSIKWK